MWKILLLFLALVVVSFPLAKTIVAAVPTDCGVYNADNKCIGNNGAELTDPRTCPTSISQSPTSSGAYNSVCCNFGTRCPEFRPSCGQNVTHNNQKYCSINGVLINFERPPTSACSTAVNCCVEGNACTDPESIVGCGEKQVNSSTGAFTGKCIIDDVEVPIGRGDDCGAINGKYVCCNNKACNTVPGGGDSVESGSGSPASVFEGPNAGTFKSLNPLNKGSLAGKLDSPGEIVSRILLFAFPLAGLILFAMLVWGGFEMVIGATSKGVEAGRQRVTAAIIGFLMLFVSYWIMQIIQFIFGVVIL